MGDLFIWPRMDTNKHELRQEAFLTICVDAWVLLWGQCH